MARGSHWTARLAKFAKRIGRLTFDFTCSAVFLAFLALAWAFAWALWAVCAPFRLAGRRRARRAREERDRDEREEERERARRRSRIRWTWGVAVGSVLVLGYFLVDGLLR